MRYTESEINSSTHSSSLAIEGTRLTDAEAAEMERQSAANPEDLDLRTRLLGNYSRRRHVDEAIKSLRNAHILWLIANRPRSHLAASPYTDMHPAIEADAYAAAKDLWLEQTERSPNDVSVLDGAARFMLQNDRETADALYARAQALEPDNPYWPQHRGFLALLGNSHLPEPQQRERAQTALEFYRQALAMELPEPLHVFREPLLQYGAKAAFAAQAFEEARQYAEELLAYGASQPERNAGDALHHGSLLLGRLAFRSGDMESAKIFLLTAGEVAGSPVLGSFGPNMLLAKELLEAGEKETVLAYFDRCARFWKSEKLAVWRAEIERGEMPKFGGSLTY